ncbi:MAG: hypothetical protein ACK5MU_02755 [Candidatus Saccharimonadales bacterium]
MEISWEFSIGWFMLGLLILIAGGLVVVFYRQISENLASGVSSYDKVKLFGLIGCGVGLLIMMNLHTLLLQFFVSLFIK